MALSESLLPEFDHEMANTRIALERVPAEKFGWKPHDKSGTMGWLASHLATMPGWVGSMLKEDSLDIAPGGAQMEGPKSPATREELLQTFDKNVADARAVLASTPDAAFFKQWSLLNNGTTLFSMPRIAVYRSFVMNHAIHHRGQLTVYLRLNNIPVPALYGPSADEAKF
jgi:uncharacterized damage-inducible protein DinB